jgi:1-acyl-sn-glycerol-3-phosphate acyltransferase
MVDKGALRLPAPIEWAWTVLFLLVVTILPLTTSLLSALVLFPLLSWWNMPLMVKLNCIIADWTWYLMGGLGMEKYGRSKYNFYGDKIPMRENAFLISNHLTILDWAFLFSVAGRRGRLGTMKFFAKKSITYVPGFGWGIYLLDHLLISRNWLADKSFIASTFAKLKQRKLPFWVISFLEGTRKTPKKLEDSHAYAKKMDLPHLKHVLLPRTKGFVATVTSLRDEISAIYDVTYAYKGDRVPGIRDVAMRRLPDLHFHVRRIPIKDLPTDEKALAEWCMDAWIKKDALLEQFHTTGAFPNPCPVGEWSLPYQHEKMLLFGDK